MGVGRNVFRGGGYLHTRHEGAQLREEPDRKQLGRSRTVCGAAAQLSVKAATGSVHGSRNGHRPVALFTQTGHRPYLADSWSSQRRHFPTSLFGGDQMWPQTDCRRRETCKTPCVSPQGRCTRFPAAMLECRGTGSGGRSQMLRKAANRGRAPPCEPPRPPAAAPDEPESLCLTSATPPRDTLHRAAVPAYLQLRNNRNLTGL